ncbi:bifunctional ornithine acetyltransferase/N-acetylglutamate synthase [Sporosarcina sp. P21c]|uniref:bifunctional glutamate N-acetyltransferase/amino-acid acetyltransferase ArgJ n=1 Tax=unclassified Sporosarcina TaxID=2647733 RepID=UPI000C16C6FE|nr:MULTISPECIES: bifunctional glutamate N-acetyltransferase/amino-acid acetyltransferase ArgJ [unclassified Sporosarcina]PIC67029.1 bifunctional ornithine acetyltransferase/N-acetylglutamate synthase [Sporosarcina sp. P16a]PIC83368.1 bifunctional ornithine acetyltransferase/N-acetylglutamate synthase [Sporosarcina sp. P1]PIC88616.1 bifunctional ornithine acetyltransferase/N-acetylglutamate synthase [Sporosarcina sp. P21c]PIC92482.1 bifunctional ornithine acetyltransferase/N-acetylglutamate synt
METIESMKRISRKNIISPKGFKAVGIHCGLKHKKNDLALLVSEVPASVAGVFTTNVIQAAPLQVTKKVVYETQKMQAIVINSGNANACTGKQGMQDAMTMQQKTAEHLGIDSNLVGIASTGVIGEQMNMGPLLSGIEKLQPIDTLEGSIQFSQAILTTDTVTKNTAYATVIDDREIVVAGVAKGSGMIEPNMATMLGFITTDANIESAHLQTALKEITDVTFNSITVDGDTSTNDMVLVMANGLAGNHSLTPDHPEWQSFVDALHAVSRDLAKMIAKDGEGATKLIEAKVTGAVSDEQARQIAKSVVGSPLVKTAVFGCDANWGRIIAAVGYSGATIDPEDIKIYIGDTVVVEGGEPIPFSEEKLLIYLKQHEVKFAIELNQGAGQGMAWGCDLTYDYVQINATYRT